MVRAPQGEETLFEAHNLFVRFWQGNEARRLGSISSFTARRICAIPVDRGGLMSAVSAALLAMPPSRLSAQVPQRKAHKSRRDASYASLGELCDAAKPALVQAGMPSLSSRINVKLAWCTELAALRKRPQQCCASLSTPQTNAQCIACCSPRDWLQKEAHIASLQRLHAERSE